MNVIDIEKIATRGMLFYLIVGTCYRTSLGSVLRVTITYPSFQSPQPQLPYAFFLLTRPTGQSLPSTHHLTAVSLSFSNSCLGGLPRGQTGQHQP